MHCGGEVIKKSLNPLCKVIGAKSYGLKENLLAILGCLIEYCIKHNYTYLRMKRVAKVGVQTNPEVIVHHEDLESQINYKELNHSCALLQVN